MANVTRYSPSPVIVPPQIPLSRNLVSSVRRADKRPMSSAELANYDARTIFYDVLFDAQSGEVVALGPPLLNLEKDLLPIVARVSGRLVPRKVEKHPNLSIFRFDVRAVRPQGDPILDIRFPAFAARVSPRRVLHPGERSELSLMTVQKDSPVAWILDWIRWHHRHHGVSRIVLYDNASTDISDLAHALEGLNSEIEIVLVEWPFPHGTPGNRSNRFCQIGALNHCRVAFGEIADWCLNLDIDEYLVTRPRFALAAMLERLDSAGGAALLFNSYTVPPTREQPERAADRNICFYRHRFRRPHHGAMKYAYSPRRVQLNLVHAALPSTRVGTHLSRLFYASLPKRLARIAGAFPSWLARLIPVRVGAVDEVHFLHYWGLNTGWKGPSSRDVPAEAVETDRLVAMPDIPDQAREAGIAGSCTPASRGQD